MPGIESVDHKCLNRGSIKKTTVKIKANNRDQFDIIDVLYLRLGYTVLLEFGWDKYIDNKGRYQTMNTSPISTKFFNSSLNNSSYDKILPIIEQYREETNGNYEGIFGTVSNFSWDFDKDGSYNITLEIISLGDVIESLKVNLPPIGEVPPSSAVLTATITTNFASNAADEDQFYDDLFPQLEVYLLNYFDTISNTPFLVGNPIAVSRGYNGGTIFQKENLGEPVIRFDSLITNENLIIAGS